MRCRTNQLKSREKIRKDPSPGKEVEADEPGKGGRTACSRGLPRGPPRERQFFIKPKTVLPPQQWPGMHSWALPWPIRTLRPCKKLRGKLGCADAARWAGCAPRRWASAGAGLAQDGPQGLAPDSVWGGGSEGCRCCPGTPRDCPRPFLNPAVTRKARGNTPSYTRHRGKSPGTQP